MKKNNVTTRIPKPIIDKNLVILEKAKLNKPAKHSASAANKYVYSEYPAVFNADIPKENINKAERKIFRTDEPSLFIFKFYFSC